MSNHSEWLAYRSRVLLPCVDKLLREAGFGYHGNLTNSAELLTCHDIFYLINIKCRVQGGIGDLLVLNIYHIKN
eukprot:14574340-Ditylum_brightwellii.AAC.1